MYEKHRKFILLFNIELLFVMFEVIIGIHNDTCNNNTVVIYRNDMMGDVEAVRRK